MSNNLLINTESYKRFLHLLEKRISKKEFEENLLSVQKIDSNHYQKKITVQKIRDYILEYDKKEIKENQLKSLQILLPGNPDIVFILCLEAIRYNMNLLICIEDFCLAQNTLIISLVNQVIEECKLKNKIEIKNLLKDNEIIQDSKYTDATICIGNSNLYNRLEGKIKNLRLNSYGIFEIYFDSEDSKEIEKTIYEYLTLNQYESEIYDDLDFEDALKAINRYGYEFCSILISKNKEKIKKFKENINSKYIIINDNPFKKIKFELFI